MTFGHNPCTRDMVTNTVGRRFTLLVRAVGQMKRWWYSV